MVHLKGASPRQALALLATIRLEWIACQGQTVQLIGLLKVMKITKSSEAVFLVVCDPSVNKL